MNLNPKAKRILCFGDSNTRGYIPGSGKRFPVNIRWTGVLQKLLGNDYEIIEEGLDSRTTNIDDPEHFGKSGAIYLPPCLQTHYPLDLVILMIGTNDLKKRFYRTSEEIAQGVEALIKIIKDPEYNEGKEPKLILLSPPLVDESVEGVKEKYLGAEEKSKQLGALYQRLAQKYQLSFLDAAKILSPSQTDGYHLDAEAHKKLAEILYSQIQEFEI